MGEIGRQETNNDNSHEQNGNKKDSERLTSGSVLNTNLDVQLGYDNIPIEANTAITEYLEVVKSEYDIERAKKESFESRAGIILALIGTLAVFVLEMVNLNDILSSFSTTITFWIFLKIVSGLLVYGGFIFTVVNAFLTISTKKHANFEVKNIDESLIKENRMTALARLIFVYKNIIIEHRELNENRAKAFKRSILGCIISIVALVIYSSIK